MYGFEIRRFKCNIKKLLIHQKKSVRFIAGLDFRDFFEEACETLQMLPVTCTIIYKVLVNVKVNNSFQINHKIYSNITRGRDNIQIVNYHNQIRQAFASLTFGPKLWSTLQKKPQRITD